MYATTKSKHISGLRWANYVMETLSKLELKCLVINRLVNLQKIMWHEFW